MHKIVADLGRDHDLIPLIRESFRDQLFAQSVAVRVSRIEQRNPEIECLMHQRDRLSLSKISPPTSRNRPQTEADLTHGQVCIFVSPKAHGTYLTTDDAEVTGRIRSACACSL